jgi:hypothetical protein
MPLQQRRVIGINTAIYSPSGGSVGIGFAVPDFLQIDAPINRGNSGGPTFDLHGCGDRRRWKNRKTPFRIEVGKSSPVSGRLYAVMVLAKTQIRRAVRHASRSPT